MTKDKEISYLKEIIELQRKLIEQLTSGQETNTMTTTTVNLPFITPARCEDGCVYPYPWLGFFPPSCQKCGNQACGTITSYDSNQVQNGSR